MFAVDWIVASPVAVIEVVPVKLTSDSDVVTATATSAGSKDAIPAQPDRDKSVLTSDVPAIVTSPPDEIMLSSMVTVERAVLASNCTTAPAPVSGSACVAVAVMVVFADDVIWLPLVTDMVAATSACGLA